MSTTDDSSHVSPAPMWKFVIYSIIGQAVTGLVIGLVEVVAYGNLGSATGVITLIVGVLIAAALFEREHKRPATTAERHWFAAGNLLAAIALALLGLWLLKPADTTLWSLLRQTYVDAVEAGMLPLLAASILVVLALVYGLPYWLFGAATRWAAAARDRKGGGV